MDKQPKTYDSLSAIDEGGCYEERDGKWVRVEEPTAPAVPKPAEAGPGAAVGAASGEPSARAEDAPVATAAAAPAPMRTRPQAG